MSFQENLRKYREQAGYTQAKEFASKIGVPYSTYAGYENQGREPKYELLIKIATILGITIDELIGYNPNEFEYCKKIIDRAGYLANYTNIELDEITIWLPSPKRKDGSEITPPIFITLSKHDFMTVAKRAHTLYMINNRPNVLLRAELERQLMLHSFHQNSTKIERAYLDFKLPQHPPKD